MSLRMGNRIGSCGWMEGGPRVGKYNKMEGEQVREGIQG